MDTASDPNWAMQAVNVVHLTHAGVLTTTERHLEYTPLDYFEYEHFYAPQLELQRPPQYNSANYQACIDFEANNEPQTMTPAPYFASYRPAYPEVAEKSFAPIVSCACAGVARCTDKSRFTVPTWKRLTGEMYNPRNDMLALNDYGKASTDYDIYRFEKAASAECTSDHTYSRRNGNGNATASGAEYGGNLQVEECPICDGSLKHVKPPTMGKAKALDGMSMLVGSLIQRLASYDRDGVGLFFTDSRGSNQEKSVGRNMRRVKDSQLDSEEMGRADSEGSWLVEVATGLLIPSLIVFAALMPKVSTSSSPSVQPRSWDKNTDTTYPTVRTRPG